MWVGKFFFSIYARSMCVKVSDLQSCSPRTCYQMWTPAARAAPRVEVKGNIGPPTVAINWMQPIDKITARLKQCERGHRKIGPWLLCCKLLHLFNIPHGFLPLILSPGIENLILSFPSPQKVFIFFIYFLKNVSHFLKPTFYFPRVLGVSCWAAWERQYPGGSVVVTPLIVRQLGLNLD